MSHKNSEEEKPDQFFIMQAIQQQYEQLTLMLGDMRNQMERQEARLNSQEATIGNLQSERPNTRRQARHNNNSPPEQFEDEQDEEDENNDDRTSIINENRFYQRRERDDRRPRRDDRGRDGLIKTFGASK